MGILVAATVIVAAVGILAAATVIVAAVEMLAAAAIVGSGDSESSVRIAG